MLKNVTFIDHKVPEKFLVSQAKRKKILYFYGARYQKGVMPISQTQSVLLGQQLQMTFLTGARAWATPHNGPDNSVQHTCKQFANRYAS